MQFQSDFAVILTIHISPALHNHHHPAGDVDRVRPVPAAMVHWIRQIKEMLSSLDSIEMPEKAGPLDEINFWNDRCTHVDLFS